MAVFDLKHIHALHSLTHLPILLMSSDYELIHSYGNLEYLSPYYQVIKEASMTLDADFSFLEGLLEESFLLFPISNYIICIGPFYSRKLEKSYQETLANQFLSQYPIRTLKDLLDYMAIVPTFSLAQIRSLLITIDAYFQTHFEQECQDKINQLQHHAQKITTDLHSLKHLNHELRDSYQLPDAFTYLNHIMELVKLGNSDLLKKEINHIPISQVSTTAISNLRAEKDLAIVYLSRLVELGFSENTHNTQSYDLAKQYLRMIEEATNPIDVFRIRAAAILSFSDSLNNKSISDKQQLYQCILSYVANHLYDKLKVSDIANHLYISDSHLRAIFKKYAGISL
ncbi:putative YSIRK-targeted surface antigen transcriptional regulator [Streptococcus ictaluri 707-05]|uniref:YSIRK-targeted surface antigen transcriptional regulator n=1 Tax=Streptococcus ictaluri 707-05 TaxID=764299 RepID=G5K4N7_9STRE|nr:putative YSIRK-targeted surface antigen transcriptional regulator [Streptococcus ictaluri 707-05]